MRGRGLILALVFVVIGVLVAWLTGDNSPLAERDNTKQGDKP